MNYKASTPRNVQLVSITLHFSDQLASLCSCTNYVRADPLHMKHCIAKKLFLLLNLEWEDGAVQGLSSASECARFVTGLVPLQMYAVRALQTIHSCVVRWLSSDKNCSDTHDLVANVTGAYHCNKAWAEINLLPLEFLCNGWQACTQKIPVTGECRPCATFHPFQNDSWLCLESVMKKESPWYLHNGWTDHAMRRDSMVRSLVEERSWLCN